VISSRLGCIEGQELLPPPVRCNDWVADMALQNWWNRFHIWSV